MATVKEDLVRDGEFLTLLIAHLHMKCAFLLPSVTGGPASGEL